LLDPVDPDADRQVGVPVAHRPLVADLQHDRVEPDDQVELLERPRLPLLDIVEHSVGDAADRVAADLDAVDLRQVLRDLARDIPRAYTEMILSSKPSKRRWCFGTICGSNEPSRSRANSTST